MSTLGHQVEFVDLSFQEVGVGREVSAHVTCVPALADRGIHAVVRSHTLGPRPGCAASTRGSGRSSVRLTFVTGRHLLSGSLDCMKVLWEPDRAPG